VNLESLILTQPSQARNGFKLKTRLKFGATSPQSALFNPPLDVPATEGSENGTDRNNRPSVSGAGAHCLCYVDLIAATVVSPEAWLSRFEVSLASPTLR